MKTEIKRDPGIPGGEGAALSFTPDELNSMKDLPNIDAVIDAKMGNPPAPVGGNEDDANKVAAAKAAEQQQSWISPKVLDAVKSKLPADKADEILKGINEDNFIETFLNTVTPQLSITPEAKSFNDFILNGGKAEDFFKMQEKAFDYSKLSPDDALVLKYEMEIGKSEENPDGLSKEEIQAYVNKMDSVERKIMGSQFKNALVREQQAQIAEQTQQLQTQQKTQREQERLQMTEVAKNIVGKFQNISEIYGIPVKKEDVDSFNKDFHTLVTPDENGVVPAAKLLSDDEVMYKLLFIAHKSGQIPELLSSARGKQIQQIKDTLSPNPPTRQGAGGVNNKNEIDIDKLAEPERF